MRVACWILLGAVPLAAQQFRPERYAPIPPVISGSDVYDLAAGDIDGDGITDLCVAVGRGGVVCLRSDGFGGFFDVTTSVLQPSRAFAHSLDLGDADGDGDLDLVVAHDSGSIQVCLNQGNGTFVDVTATFSPVRAPYARTVRWLKADSDGRLDLIVGCQTSAWLLLQRNGRLVDASAAGLPSIAGGLGSRVRVVDLDNDGDHDIVGMGTGGLLVNDGNGRFRVWDSTKLPHWLRVIYGCGDFDRNGLVDLVVRTGTVSLTRFELWFQTANGAFVDRTSTHLPVIRSSPYYFLMDVDIDGDGDLDLCSADGLVVNDGTGRLVDETASRWTVMRPRAPMNVWPCGVVGNFDGDGDQDVAMVDGTSLQMVSFNHFVHVSTPTEPVRGGSYRILYESLLDERPGTQFVVPCFATAPAAIAFPPHGTIGVLPAATIVGPTLRPPGTAIALSLSVPSSPSLAGRSLYLQAAVFTLSSRFGLTNTVCDRIR